MPLNAQAHLPRVIGSGGSCTRLSKFLTGGVFKSSVDDIQCFTLLTQISLIVIFTTH